MSSSTQIYTVPSIIDTPVATWDESELSGLLIEEDSLTASSYQPKFSKYNPTPGRKLYTVSSQSGLALHELKDPP
jgi:hypothetical protein